MDWIKLITAIVSVIAFILHYLPYILFRNLCNTFLHYLFNILVFSVSFSLFFFCKIKKLQLTKISRFRENLYPSS